MNIKNIAIVTAGLVFAVIICALISNSISERNLRSIDLSAVSYETEKEQQPAKALEAIADKPVPKVEEKTEDKVLYQPVSRGSREIEVEYSEETISDMPYDALTDVEAEDKDAGLEDREAEIIMEEGPPSHKIVRPLPIFEPIINDTGPIPNDSDTTYSDLSETTEQYDYDGPPVPPDMERKPLPPVTPVTGSESPETTDSDLPEFTEQYNYDGPLVPPGMESKPLPPFTPITNKTGPIATNKNR